MHSISWLSWWIWHGSGKFTLSLNLNEDPMKGNDVDDQPTLIVKLPQTHECNIYYQIKASFGVFNCRGDEHAICFCLSWIN